MFFFVFFLLQIAMHVYIIYCNTSNCVDWRLHFWFGFSLSLSLSLSLSHLSNLLSEGENRLVITVIIMYLSVVFVQMWVYGVSNVVAGDEGPSDCRRPQPLSRAQLHTAGTGVDCLQVGA